MLDIDNVRVGVTGAVYTAPTGTDIPANATAAWPTGWTDLGYVDENGVSENYDDTTTDLKVWQNSTTVRRIITGTSATIGFVLVESKPEVLEVFHKGSTLDTTTGILPVVPGTTDQRMFGLDVIDGDEEIRLVIALGEVTTRGTVTYAGTSLVGYPCTITASPVTAADWEAANVDLGAFTDEAVLIKMSSAWVAGS